MLPWARLHARVQVPVAQALLVAPVRRSGPELVLQPGNEQGVLLWSEHVWHQGLQNAAAMEQRQEPVLELVAVQEIVQELAVQAWAYVSKQR
jgi:hypothetical protein